jgi:hypothetical protein
MPHKFKSYCNNYITLGKKNRNNQTKPVQFLNEIVIEPLLTFPLCLVDTAFTTKTFNLNRFNETLTFWNHTKNACRKPRQRRQAGRPLKPVSLKATN